MPPWENVEPTERMCVHCGKSYLAKKKEAKFCSPLCKERARPKRTHPPHDPIAHQAYLARPGVRDRVRRQERDRSRVLKHWINIYKVTHGCVDCGYNAHAVALDFDHMNGKTRNVANLTSIKAVLAEIEHHDCVVRCANCHRVKSWQTRTWDRSQSSTAS